MTHSHITLVPKSLSLHLFEQDRFQAPLWKDLSKHQKMEKTVVEQRGTRQKILVRNMDGWLRALLLSSWFVAEVSFQHKQEESRTAFS